MIPLRLDLSNFLSYRKRVEIELFDIHLACISGANGSGKSSILDAITWSLFGRSRAKSDDDIVNWAASLRGEAAEIRLTFELEGVIYRVIRQRIAQKRSSLEFQIASDDGQWKTLSDSGIRKTQSTIEETLRMNYETFINASFLLQGKADEFTTKTANQRKEILADLLGVNEWDLHKQAVAIKRKEEENRLAIIDLRLEEIEKELGEQSQREANLATATALLENSDIRLEEQEQLYKQAQMNKAAVEQQEQLVDNLKKNLIERKKLLDELAVAHERRLAERASHQSLIDEEKAILTRYKQWQDSEALIRKWQKIADQNNSLLQQMKPHELKIASDRSRLEQQQLELEEQRKRIRRLKEEQPQLQKDLEEAENKFAQLAKKLEKSQQDEQKIQVAKTELQTLLADRDLLRQEERQLRRQEKQIIQMKEEKDNVQAHKIKTEEGLKLAAEALKEKEKEIEELMKANAKRHNLNEELPSLKEEMLQMKQRIDQLELESGQICPLCGQELSDEHRQTVLTELKADGQDMGDKYRLNQEKIAALNDQIGELDEIQNNKSRLENDRRILQKAMASYDNRLKVIERNFIEWRDGPETRLSELQNLLSDESDIKEKQLALKVLDEEADQRAELERQRLKVQSKLTRLNSRRDDNSRKIIEWEGNGSISGLHSNLVNVSEQLANDDFATEAREALAGLRRQVAKLGYDIEAHKAAEKESQELEDALERYQTLEQAKAAIKPLDDSLAESERRIRNTKNELSELEDQFNSAQQQFISLKEGSLDLAQVENQLNRLREVNIEAHRHVATSQQLLNVLDDQRKEEKLIRDDRDNLTQRIKRLKLLEKACGREGVQALLIERALPEIEGEANEILDRLTQGKMHIEFLTQRKLKSSERLAETLDIRISDADGERPYENYSGGEQFRINFAIRLALSQILAKRAGARLQTLVIDEGFGSQDPEGRRRLINAIETIQDDFKRILIITHIDEMRDVFPNRIEVGKGLEGSFVTVN